jgi:hypothetical protein
VQTVDTTNEVLTPLVPGASTALPIPLLSDIAIENKKANRFRQPNSFEEHFGLYGLVFDYRKLIGQIYLSVLENVAEHL